MKNLKSVLFVSIFMAAAILTVSASELKGNEIVTLGSLDTLSGTLTEDAGEWYLQTGDSLYALHLGNHDYLDSLDLNLKERESATVFGFVYEQDIAPVTLTSGEITYCFRSEDGRPLWAGRGRSNGCDECEECEDESSHGNNSNPHKRVF